MKLKLIYLFLSFAFMLVFLTNVIVKAGAINTEFSTQELPAETKDRFVSNVSIELLTEEPEKRNVMSFDINDQKMLAIGQGGHRGKEVCVYDSHGKYLYGYTFNCHQDFGIEWDGENINIYFVRSDIIMSVDSNGNVHDVKEVQNTSDNNKHHNKLLHSTSHTVGDTTYQIRNNLGIFSWLSLFYSQVVAIDADGEERIIYDAGSTQTLVTVILFVVISLLVFGITALVALNYHKEKSNN